MYQQVTQQQISKTICFILKLCWSLLIRGFPLQWNMCCKRQQRFRKTLDNFVTGNGKCTSTPLQLPLPHSCKFKRLVTKNKSHRKLTLLTYFVLSFSQLFVSFLWQSFKKSQFIQLYRFLSKEFSQVCQLYSVTSSHTVFKVSFNV